MSGKKASLLPILLVNFIGTLGYSIVLPFLVKLVIDFGGNQVIYGFLGATYSAFQLLGAPILGKWSDVVGRRKVLLISQAGTFVAWTIFLVALFLPLGPLASYNLGLTGSFVLTLPLLLLFLARGLDGLTGGNVSVANAYLSDISTTADKKKNFGKMASAASLGFIIGPALAGVLGATSYGNVLPVITALLISAIAMVTIYIMLQDVGKKDPGRDVRERFLRVFGHELKDCDKPDKVGIELIWKIPHVPYLLALYFLVFLAFNFFYVSFPYHAYEYLNWEVLDLGIFFSVMSGMMIVVQGPVLSFLSNRFSSAQLFVVGTLILIAGFLLFTRDSKTIVYIAALTFAIGNGLMWPSYLAVLSKAAGKKLQGAVQGYATSAGSLASIIGLLAGGFLYQSLEQWIFVIPAVILGCIVLTANKLRKVGG